MRTRRAMPALTTLLPVSVFSLLALPAFLSLFSLACSSDLAPCEDVGISPCDIRDDACARDLFRLTGCFRNAEDLTAPPVSVLSRSEFVDGLIGDAVVTDDPVTDRAYQWVGLLPEDTTLDGAFTSEYTDSAAAFYSSRSRRIVVDGSLSGAATDGANALLVHEFVHAQQDQELGLDAYQDGAASTDEFLGTLAVVEGEATLYQIMSLGRFGGASPDEIFWSNVVAALVEDLTQDYLATESPFAGALVTFPYSYGARLAVGAWRGGGPDAVRDGYGTFPSTLEVLTGIEADDSSLPAAPVPPTGFSVHGAPDELGAWITFGVLAGGLGEQAAVGARNEWRADRLVLYATDTDETAVTWQTVWETAEAADTFERWALGRGSSTVLVDTWRSDTVVALVASGSAETTAVFMAAMGGEG